MLHKSLELLELRVNAISQKTLQLAHWIRTQPEVGRVFYTGLNDHDQHALICRQQTGYGGVLSFEVGCSRESAWAMIDSLQLISIATNIGDTRSMITHPASTTHGKLSPDERLFVGITDRLVRLSVGLENEADLMSDIHLGLTSISSMHAEREGESVAT